MASKTQASVALLLSLNLIFFTMVSSSNCPPPPSPKPKCHSCSDPVKPTPSVPKPSPSPKAASCPVDTLKLGVCANVLKGLLGLTIGTPPKTPCCSLISDLVDLEAAVCLCTTIKASVLGINLNLPVNLSLLLNYCDKKVPKGFKCA
ncbi:Bifunctional inhibitor/lipid-transfer protein/seed storage 2S albumin superfamily protein [Euphorbia peplus]|nr:Bifunctional inhibitor/lipid-transfer protein/seed storage 2S albumin superfamily protein [Euphorbia peplus]